jgi:hypothetical protein
VLCGERKWGRRRVGFDVRVVDGKIVASVLATLWNKMHSNTSLIWVTDPKRHSTKVSAIKIDLYIRYSFDNVYVDCHQAAEREEYLVL